MASSELYEEIGRLKQQVDYLRERSEILDEANMTMHDELAKANRALRRDELEKGRLHNDICRLNEELEMQNEEIESLHDQLAKTQRTIKVQSDQIAAPSEKKSRWTTLRGKSSSKPHVDSSRAPPQFQLPQHLPSSVYSSQPVPQTGYPPRPLQQSSYPQRHSAQSGYPPPLPVQHSSQSSATSQLASLPAQHPYESLPYHPRQQDVSQHQHQYPETTALIRHPGVVPSLTEGGPGPIIESHFGRAMQLSSQSSREKEVYNFLTPSGIVVETRQADRMTSLVPDLSPLFFQGEMWARRHCGVPSKAGDAAMPLDLKGWIASLTNPTEVQTLLSKSSTRPLVVAKIINHEITTTCLRPSVIKSFRPSIDQRLSDLHSQHSTTLTISTRRGLLLAAAQIIREAVSSPRFAAWVDRQANHHVSRTWPTLSPLCVADTHAAEAQAELKSIWLEAYRVGVKMASKASIFTTEFPPVVGPQSVFNPANMVSKDYDYGHAHEHGQQGAEMALHGATVRLAVTPVVMETDFSGVEGGVGGGGGGERVREPRCLHFSNCLLRYR